MKIITWNIGLTKQWFRNLCMCLCSRKSKTCNIISEKIINENADVIFFQELYSDCFNIIKDLIGNQYKYCVYDNNIGLAIFSKTNIIFNFGRVFKRDFTSLLLETQNGLLTVYDELNKIYFINVHLSCGFCMENEFYKLKETTDFIELHEKIKHPERNYRIIIAGDFNAKRNNNYNKICKILNVKNNKANNFYSFDHICVKMNFDYIIYIDKKERIELYCTCDEKCKNISDHLLIKTEI